MPAAREQACFFDIDGTLYDNRFHQIDPALFEEFDTLRTGGTAIYLLSSRSLYETAHLPRAFLHYPYDGLIFEGGGAIFDHSLNLIEGYPLPAEDLCRLQAFCHQHNLLWRYSGAKGNFFSRIPEAAIREHWRSLYLLVPSVRPWRGEDVYNVLVWTSEPHLREQLRDLLPRASMVFYSDCIEIRAAGVSKEAVIEKLKKQHGWQRILCAGDGPNDVEMLRQADWGLAVGNACDQAKAAADEVIAPVDEGGLALWLARQREQKKSHSADDSLKSI